MEQTDVLNTKPRIRVAIADGHALSREGLRLLLATAPDLESSGLAADGFAALDLAKAGKTDVLLLETSLPNKDGLDVIREMASHHPDTHVLIIDRDMNPHHAFRVFRAGAKGFVPRDLDAAGLFEAIRQVARGRIYLPQQLKDTFSEWFLMPEGDRGADELLSNREFQVMRQLALGESNHDIAQKLHISVKTVDTHRANLLRKLHLRNNSDLTRFAVRYGYVQA